MSRIPRHQEHLKTGFTAEAVSAARFRAFASRAESDGFPELARRWRDLAQAKDALAIRLLEAAEQVRGREGDFGMALAEERYENDVLYPKMIRDTEGTGTAEVLRDVVAAQRDHLGHLESLSEKIAATSGDVA